MLAVFASSVKAPALICDIHPISALSRTCYVPDIAGWRVENLPQIPATPKFEIVPGWVCEVLSPSTRNQDLVFKRHIYAREGVTHFWTIDPNARRLQAFALSDGKWRPIAALEGMVAISVPPFENRNIPLSRLWRGIARSRSGGRPGVG